MKVWLCLLKHQAYETWEWLCKTCALARRSVRDERGHLRWMKVEPQRTLPAWATCADCERKRQAAPGYQAPTVAFTPTTAARRAA